MNNIEEISKEFALPVLIKCHIGLSLIGFEALDTLKIENFSLDQSKNLIKKIFPPAFDLLLQEKTKRITVEYTKKLVVDYILSSEKNLKLCARFDNYDTNCQNFICELNLDSDFETCLGSLKKISCPINNKKNVSDSNPTVHIHETINLNRPMISRGFQGSLWGPERFDPIFPDNIFGKSPNDKDGTL